MYIRVGLIPSTVCYKVIKVLYFTEHNENGSINTYSQNGGFANNMLHYTNEDRVMKTVTQLIALVLFICFCFELPSAGCYSQSGWVTFHLTSAVALNRLIQSHRVKL